MSFRPVAVMTFDDPLTQSKNFIPFTARLMAAMRAREADRPDPLFYDPFAEALAGEEAFAMLNQRLSEDDRAYVAVRTRFFDDFLQTAVTEAAIQQVVLLAAGMDARAFRLPWPAAVKLYELDQTEVLAYKAAQLKGVTPSCDRCAIAADLTQPWQQLLLEQGYRPELPTAWLVEGLLMYLTEAEVHQLLRTVTNLAAPGSQLGLDLVSPASLDYEPYKGFFKSGFEHPEELLAEHGWNAKVIQPGDHEANYNRYARRFPPRSVPDVSRVFFVTAVRQNSSAGTSRP
jgi:methyltransferase (TIGR00027 family)